VYAREVEGRELTFDFAEGLVKDNLLIVDRETNSIWSQLDSKAVSGPMKGAPLQSVPSIQTTWKFWRKRYPKTRVLVVRGEEGRRYFYRDRKPGTRPKRPDTTHNTSKLGLGLVVDGQAMFFPFRELRRVAPPVRVKLGGEWVAVYYEEEALTAWAEDGKGNLLSGVLSYEEGWVSFNPESRTYRGPRATQ
jgi:hypothetical protein